ncbi:MAG: hypothetical protein EZS28_003918 [Streblomastix strix]|uniref:Uncharacterized protein n=1 Tax=Streblomastix strix TaxID=222440 RepID=A0A5J4X1P7_9EUKA|nr:MAG: hypothetical protein EZS28_003918 [Streblomastix strix]
MTNLKRQKLYFQLRRFINLSQREVPIKIKQLASIIDKQNFQRVQVRNASRYLQRINSVRTRELKNQNWKENVILHKNILYELYCWKGAISRNQEKTLEVRISEAVMVSNASPKGLGVILKLQVEDTLVKYGKWNKEQRNQISNKKEMEAIFLDIYHYRQTFGELQIKAILIISDSSTAVQDITKQRAGETLVAEVKKIVKQQQ